MDARRKTGRKQDRKVQIPEWVAWKTEVTLSLDENDQCL